MLNLLNEHPAKKKILRIIEQNKTLVDLKLSLDLKESHKNVNIEITELTLNKYKYDFLSPDLLRYQLVE